MNNIVNLSQLINRLAKVTDTDPNTARRFLRTFFATIEDALAEGETVEIKGIGTFRRCDDPAVGTPGTVGFAPDDDFASEINRPFAVFEAVELADGLTAEDLEPAEEPEIAQETTEPAVAPIEETLEETVEETPAEPEEKEPEQTAEAQDEHKAPWEIYGKGPFFEEEKEPETIEETITVAQTEETPEPEAEPEIAEEPYAEEETAEEDGDGDTGSHSRSWIWIAAAIVLIAGIVGYFAAVYAVPIPSYDDYEEEVTEQIESTNETEAEVQAPLATETSEPAIAEEPAVQTPAPAPAPVEPAKAAPAAKEPKYDTVSAKRYLAIMAREYYGRSIYWVFIYEANADKLSDPNKVAPGTKVLIPDKESLPGVTDAERMAIAEKKAAQIQARYK